MSGRRAVWEVARRELVERSRSKALRISLALLLVFAVGGAIAAARVSSGMPTDDVGLVGARSVAVQPAIGVRARVAGRRVVFHRLADATAAGRAVRDGTLDVVLVDGRRLLVERSRSEPAVRVVQDAVAGSRTLERLRAAGLGEAQALAALAVRPLPVAVLEPGGRQADDNRALIFIGLLTLFVALVAYGQMVASSVTEEKSSRVVELLLTTVSPRRLLTGKVLGIGLLGLGQLVVAGAAALAAGRLAGGRGLPSAAPEAVALVVLWFILGYALFSVAYAAVGALISRHEDLDSTAAPINAMLIGSYWLAMLLVFDEPDGTPARVAAFVPPLAPLVVPARMVLGDMSAIELAAAIALDLLATAGLIVLAARVYERAILQIGARVRLGRVLGGGALEQRSVRAGAARLGRVAWAGVLLRGLAIVLVVAGALALEDSPAVAAGLIALGLLLTALRRGGRHGRRGAAG